MKQDLSFARQTQIQELFEELADLPPGKQASLLDTICRTDEQLGREVATLLRRLEQADEQFERVGRNLVRESRSLGAAEQPGTRIGNYTLVEPVGEGGFGTVWLAEQEQPVRRQVALKIIKVGMDTQEVVARFEAERQALALMEHPGIATVFDAGATATGRPYFVMELVRGTPITRYCDEQGLSVPARLRLFIEVCHAVQHAHQKGVIHRDIKPSNILVTVPDNSPVPKIIDFGIAKATTRQLTDKTLHTRLHAFMGTPVYCSPEQIAHAGLDIDTRSDIYSLGVVLYELLTGCLPFDPDKLASSAFEVVSRMIREVDPPRPSAQNKPRAQLLRGDLDWIVLHCLEKDRARRYATASELAGDLERHLRHLPVLARPPTLAYRLGKFVRRNKAVVIGAAAVVMALLLGIAASTWQAVRATRAERITGAALASEELARRQSEALHLEATAKEFIFENQYGGNTHGLALAIAALERVDSAERRRLALAALWAGPLANELKPMAGHIPCDDAEFTRDGSWLITCSRGPEVLLWPADGGPPVALPGDPGYQPNSLELSPGGEHLVVTYKVQGAPLFTPPWKQVLWDMATLQPIKEWPIDKWGPDSISPDGSWLFAYSLERRTPYAGVARYSLEDGSIVPLGSPHIAHPPHLRFPGGAKNKYAMNPSADMHWLVSWEENDVYVSAIGDRSLGEKVWIGRQEERVQTASISPRGELVSAADRRWMSIWSKNQPGQPLARLPSMWTSAEFDLENSRVFGSWPDPNLCYVAYDLRAPVGAKGIQFLPVRTTPYGMSILPGGDWIAMTGWSEIGSRESFFYNMRAVWPFHVDTGIADLQVENFMQFSQDHHQVAFVSRGRVLLMDLSSAEFPKRVLYESPGNLVIYVLQFSPTEGRLLVGTHRDGAWLVPLDGGDPVKLPDAPSFTSAADFNADGTLIAVGGGFADLPPEERYARVLDRAGRLVARIGDGGNEVVNGIKFIRKNELVVSTTGGLRLWNFETGQTRLLKPGEHGFVAVSGHHILATDLEGVWLYDFPSLAGRKLAMASNWAPGLLHVEALAIAPDERFVAVKEAGGTLCVQYIDQDRYHLLPGTDPGLADLWISGDGLWLGSFHGTGTLSYWPVPRGEPLHDRPLDEFLAILRRQTNIRTLPDADNPDGYRYEIEPFPGWQTNPTWQEWYSTEYMDKIAWDPLIDLPALGIDPAAY